MQVVLLSLSSLTCPRQGYVNILVRDLPRVPCYANMRFLRNLG